MALDAAERVVLLLPVGAQQVRREIAEEPERAERVVDVGAGPPAGGDDAADDDLVVGRDPRRGQGCMGGRCGAGEQRFHDGLVGTGAHEVGLRPTAERHVEGLEQDRLPRTGLAGDDVQPGLEDELELVDDREVADPQRAQHPRFLTGRPSRAWSAARRSRCGRASGRARPVSGRGARSPRRHRRAAGPPGRRR